MEAIRMQRIRRAPGVVIATFGVTATAHENFDGCGDTPARTGNC
jgi:hypothetical protein